MNEHWPQLRKAIEHAIHSAETAERGGYRVHVKSAERIAGDIARHAKGPEKDHAREIEGGVHKATNQIEVKNGLPMLQAALAITKNYAKDGEPAAP
jgi:hypothetical protein